jgi:hypothetical protein
MRMKMITVGKTPSNLIIRLTYPRIGYFKEKNKTPVALGAPGVVFVRSPQ